MRRRSTSSTSPTGAATNQQFANLVTSKAWADEITPKVTAKGYRPMFYYTVDARTVATRKGFARTIRTPDDMKGMKMRIPPSKLLGQVLSARRREPQRWSRGAKRRPR
jgi:TRAP-type C4-dicarboxylate transport system substrate-binding protein